jgi:hypothetical protein
LPPRVIQGVQKELLSLRPSDILTKNKLARATSIQIEIAEKILIELFKEKKLQLKIRVDCLNDDYPHSKWFNSLDDYYKTDQNLQCLDCGASYDWKNAKVGFKRGIYR